MTLYGTTIGTEAIAGQTIEIRVTRNGEFAAEVGGEEFSAESKAALVELLRKAIKKQNKLSPVAVTILDWTNVRRGRGVSEDRQGQYVHATLRGKNPRTRAWLISVGDEKISMDGYGYQFTIARRLTEAETNHFQELWQTIEAAKTALEKWKASVTFDAQGWLEKTTGEKEQEAED